MGEGEGDSEIYCYHPAGKARGQAVKYHPSLMSEALRYSSLSVKQ